ncbi:hypothetical protein [Bradyrhizobium japonicum]|uniref:hypothetical protein n=1 Tax=Bradyrhizobium japonicum TaxID=375 RepID=UPI001E508972|nr:hypothetical protein [Bradyrhizobium japonicum]MCD9825321.1 hypothetical protein [Bradyrhizobium japonicum]MCD9898298.1 hypothetical protein [Bradyrhizobium japonicum]MEB2674935.1 hypothetical protein [Bradyrhizobium japonicum]WLB33321.1 hypothetical protein QIH85_22955 [Bradyrhizobium japonicum]WRI94083.1 hypothetical protein R3F75_25340 [Bradyrhizobium japonicum]
MASAPDSIKAAESRLDTAKFGLADMKNPKRALSGLLNAVVFARMVTFALQNMRNEVDGFAAWYDPIVAELKNDQLMKFFWNLRTEIEKKAEPVAQRGMRIGKLNTNEIYNLPRPPGAVGFFIGDPTGGSGWNVRAPDGTTEKYYIDPPPAWGVAAVVTLKGVPVEFKDVPATELVERYLDRMQGIIEGAKAKFASGVKT